MSEREWRYGDTQEFLGLSDQEMEIVNLRTEVERLTRENEELRKDAERLGKLLAACQKGRDSILAFAEQLTHPDCYRGERISGVLAGCKRGPSPTPEQIATRVRVGIDAALAKQGVKDE